MTLEFNKLNAQLSDLGQTTADESKDREEKTRLALEWLRHAAAEPDAARAKVFATRKPGMDWHGAYPPEAPHTDPLDQSVDCSEPSEALTLVAADGSQIHPDQHAAALYYLVNVGAIVLRTGSGQTPRVFTQPELHCGYDELHDDQGNLIPTSVVDARRDQAELRMLADQAEKSEPPVVAFKDGPLLLWGYLETTPGAKRRREQNIEEYLGTLDRLRKCGAAVAGYVDRSLRFDVSRMLWLSQLKADHLTAENLEADKDPLRGLSDEDLFQFLKPGHRSARFIIQSHVNKTYAEHGHEIWFFFLNVSQQPDQPEVVRVEVPAWVARDETALNRVHAALVQQSQILEGAPYPYVLARADELAVVGTEEKEHLEELVIREIMQRGQQATPSRKARAKEQARGGRRKHQL